MSQLVTAIQRACQGLIDFQGQKTGERVAQVGLGLSAVIAFFVGFALQSVKMSLLVYAFGGLLTFLAVVPPWPYLNRHPVHWRSTPVTGKKDI